MGKKKVITEQPIEQVEEEQIPEEVITKSNDENVDYSKIPKKPKKGRKDSFAHTQRVLLLQEMKGIIREEFLNTWELKQQKKREMKELEEKARKEREEAELFEAFKAFKHHGQNPITSEKPKKVTPKDKGICDFCKKEVLLSNLPKHVSACIENPDGKYKDKFKYKFEKKKKVKEVEEEEVKQEKVEEQKVEKKQPPQMFYQKKQPIESIW
jgi:hypothetical protein